MSVIEPDLKLESIQEEQEKNQREIRPSDMELESLGMQLESLGMQLESLGMQLQPQLELLRKMSNEARKNSFSPVKDEIHMEMLREELLREGLLKERENLRGEEEELRKAENKDLLPITWAHESKSRLSECLRMSKKPASHSLVKPLIGTVKSLMVDPYLRRSVERIFRKYDRHIWKGMRELDLPTTSITTSSTPITATATASTDTTTTTPTTATIPLTPIASTPTYSTPTPSISSTALPSISNPAKLSRLQTLTMWFSSHSASTLPLTNFINNKILKEVAKIMRRDFRGRYGEVVVTYILDMSESFQKILGNLRFDTSQIFMEIAHSELERLQNDNNAKWDFESSHDETVNSGFEPIIELKADPDHLTLGKDSTAGCICAAVVWDNTETGMETEFLSLQCRQDLKELKEGQFSLSIFFVLPKRRGGGVPYGDKAVHIWKLVANLFRWVEEEPESSHSKRRKKWQNPVSQGFASFLRMR
ncbi:hypothetical protein M422DRAFT_24309 [Sphaerobolus stellatus SS14]|nr:hypothetical protein M422DRAFT_24309 [Sphaerobolus stellatus SS14]